MLCCYSIRRFHFFEANGIGAWMRRSEGAAELSDGGLSGLILCSGEGLGSARRLGRRDKKFGWSTSSESGYVARR